MIIKLFHKKGGNIEIIGLDMLDAKSQHPFALRRLLPIPELINNSKTKRQKDLELMASNFNLIYNPERQTTIFHLENFMFFKTKKIEYTYNHLSDDNGSNSIFDITFSEGEFIAKEVVRSTMLYIKL